MKGGPRLTVSVIIPTLNEADRIGALLDRLAALDPTAQWIVTDGGSSDATCEIAAGQGATVVRGPRGRALQMNAGARAATGNVLWFVHADSALPDEALTHLRAWMASPGNAGGCFRLLIPEKGLAYRLCDRAGNVAVDLLSLACGDHGIFARREAFIRVGGYPEVAVMEDVELYRRLGHEGRVRQLRDVIVTSPRRWRERGAWKVTLTYLRIWALYLSGATPETLERVYRGVAGQAQTSAARISSETIGQ